MQSMALENIYYIGQTVAVIVIIATLFAILWQGQQTNRIARAQLTQSTWLQSGMMQMSLFDTPEKADLMHRALFQSEPLGDVDRLRLEAYLSIAMGTHEAAFNLYRRGLIEEGAYNGLAANTPRYLSAPIVRDWWRRRRNDNRDPKFVALVDAIMEQQDAAQAGAPIKQEKTT